jgi:hypothetical protein
MHKKRINNWICSAGSDEEQRYRTNLLAGWMLDYCGMTKYYKELTDDEAFRFSLQVIRDDWDY